MATGTDDIDLHKKNKANKTEFETSIFESDDKMTQIEVHCLFIQRCLNKRKFIEKYRNYLCDIQDQSLALYIILLLTIFLPEHHKDLETAIKFSSNINFTPSRTPGSEAEKYIKLLEQQWCELAQKPWKADWEIFKSFQVLMGYFYQQPLYVALDQENLKALCMLIQHKADLSTQEFQTKTEAYKEYYFENALTFTAKHGKTKSFQFLLDNGLKETPMWTSYASQLKALNSAINGSHKAIVYLLLSNGVSPNVNAELLRGDPLYKRWKESQLPSNDFPTSPPLANSIALIYGYRAGRAGPDFPMENQAFIIYHLVACGADTTDESVKDNLQEHYHLKTCQEIFKQASEASKEPLAQRIFNLEQVFDEVYLSPEIRSDSQTNQSIPTISYYSAFPGMAIKSPTVIINQPKSKFKKHKLKSSYGT